MLQRTDTCAAMTSPVTYSKQARLTRSLFRNFAASPPSSAVICDHSRLWMVILAFPRDWREYSNFTIPLSLSISKAFLTWSDENLVLTFLVAVKFTNVPHPRKCTRRYLTTLSISFRRALCDGRTAPGLHLLWVRFYTAPRATPTA